MIPVYDDSRGGSAGSVTISGTADITYMRRCHLSCKLVHDQKFESAPFELVNFEHKESFGGPAVYG